MHTAEELYHQALDRLAEAAPEQAVALLREALALEPEFADAQHGLVRALGDAGQLGEAIDAAHALAEQCPEDPLAFTALSIALQRAGKVPEAEAAGTRAKLLGWKQQLRASRESHTS